MDIDCTLLAAVVHKGPSINYGHFVSYVFNTENTAILCNDALVKVINSKTLLTSNEFMRNVYMCFYTKGNRFSPSIVQEIQHRMMDTHGTKGENAENIPWAPIPAYYIKLSKCGVLGKRSFL